MLFSNENCGISRFFSILLMLVYGNCYWSGQSLWFHYKMLTTVCNLCIVLNLFRIYEKATINFGAI